MSQYTARLYGGRGKKNKQASIPEVSRDPMLRVLLGNEVSILSVFSIGEVEMDFNQVAMELQTSDYSLEYSIL